MGFLHFQTKDIFLLEHLIGLGINRYVGLCNAATQRVGTDKVIYIESTVNERNTHMYSKVTEALSQFLLPIGTGLKIRSTLYMG